MSARALAGLAGLLLLAHSAAALDLRQRSDSVSRQFSIYCEDVALRHRVVSFVEEVKTQVLQVLGTGDSWKAPIIISLERASTAEPGEPPVRLRLVATQPVFKVEINVKIGDDPADVYLQRQIVRAVLLEYAYRDRAVTGGMVFQESPWWVIDGIIETIQRKELGVNSALFQQLVETNKLPPIEDFLTDKPLDLGPTLQAFDRSLAMCVVQLLCEQTGGRASLARLVRHWPESSGEVVAELKKEFPALAAEKQTLQKWWTVNLARYAAANRYQGLTAEQTEKELAGLLQIELPVSKDGAKKSSAIEEFPAFLKLPGSRPALAARHAEVIGLSTRANVLFRPIIVEYERVLALLAAGKTRGVADRLARLATERAKVLSRSTQITDYLNWYEATQMTTMSDTFRNYLKYADELQEQEKKARDPIAKYLDDLELELDGGGTSAVPLQWPGTARSNP